MKTKTFFKWKYVNGLKQVPKDLDFHITPVLTFGQATKEEMDNLGTAWGLALEWGHWAIGFGIYKVYLK